MDLKQIIALNLDIYQLERKFKGIDAIDASESIDDSKLCLMLKGLAQHINTHALPSRQLELASQLHTFLENNQHSAITLSQTQQALFDYCDGLFLFLLKQSRLSKSLYSSMVKLKIPYLIVLLEAHKDDEPSTENQDRLKALRRYYELYIRCLTGWDNQAGGRAKEFKTSVQKNCLQLVNLFPPSNEKINEMYDNLILLISQYQHQSGLLESRITQSISKRYISGDAEYAIDYLYNEHFGGRYYHKYFVMLIEKYWRKYLQSVFLRDGEQSDGWHEVQEITQQIAVSWNIKTVVTSRRKLRELERLKPLLNRIHLPQENVRQLFSALQKVVDDKEQEHAIKIPKKDFETLQKFSGETQGIDIELKKMRVGHWVIFAHKNKRFRGKLIHKNLLKDRFIFTNLSGQEVLDTQGEQLSRWLNNQKLLLITSRISCDDGDRWLVETLTKRCQKITQVMEEKKQRILQQKQQQKKKREREILENYKKQQAEAMEKQLLEQQQQSELQQEMARKKRQDDIEQEQINLKALAAGAWVEFIDEQGQLSVNKLAFILKSSNKMVFVNELGIKTHELSSQQLAVLIVDGQANVTDWGSQYEGQLESLVSAQRQEMFKRDNPLSNRGE